jgi:5-methyltetrahydrofolate--homocysteine methyltransferase
MKGALRAFLAPSLAMQGCGFFLLYPFLKEQRKMDRHDNLETRIRRYQAFWNRAAVDRPLIGFSLGGWFPLKSYSAMERLRGIPRLEPEMIRPEALFADYDRLIEQFDKVEDDVIRAVAPIPPFPWFEAMLGVPVEVGNESIWAREGGFDYAQMDQLDFSPQNPWRRKYLELVAALSDRYRGKVPVGQPILRGSSDMVASLRGSQQMIFDFYDCPDLFKRLAAKCTKLIIDLVEEQHRITGFFAGGTVIEQFALWAPGKIIRMQ